MHQTNRQQREYNNQHESHELCFHEQELLVRIITSFSLEQVARYT